MEVLSRILKNWKDDKNLNRKDYEIAKHRFYSELLSSIDFKLSLKNFNKLFWYDKKELLEKIPNNISQDFLDRFIMIIAESDEDFRVRNIAFEKILELSGNYNPNLQKSILRRVEGIYSNLVSQHRLLFIHKHKDKVLPESYMMNFFHRIAIQENNIQIKRKACRILEEYVEKAML